MQGTRSMDRERGRRRNQQIEAPHISMGNKTRTVGNNRQTCWKEALGYHKHSLLGNSKLVLVSLAHRLKSEILKVEALPLR